MTWAFIAQRGTANDKTASTSKSVSPNAGVAAGRILVVRVSSDNRSTASGQTNDHTSVVDSKANAYTKVREQTYSAGAAADGVAASLWISRLATALTTSDTVTVNFSGSITAKVIALEEFSITGNQIAVQGNNAASFASTTLPTVTLSGLASQEYLWLGVIGTEGPNGDTFTQDADYANNTSVGTTGGTGTANVSNRFGSRVYTGTSDTYNPTLGTARDCVDILGAIRESSVPVIVERTPSESMGAVTDSVAVAVIRAVPVSEPSISVSDSVERATVKSVGLSEPSIAVSDLASYNIIRDRSPSEPLGAVSDSVALAVTRSVSVDEPSISVTDIVERSLVLMRSLSESLGNVGDTPETSLVRDVSILEPPIPFSDSIVEEVTRSVSVLEPLIDVSDSASYVLLRERSLAEPMGTVGDSVSFTIQRSREVSEPPIPVSDSVDYILLRVRSLSEPLGFLIDSVDLAVTRSVSIYEPPISVSDLVLAEVPPTPGSIFARSVLENIGLLVDLVLAEVEGGRPSFRPKVHRIYWDDLWYVKHTKKGRTTKSL